MTNPLTQKYGNQRRWVNFRLEKRGDKVTKIPYMASTGQMASSTDESTWSTYDEALEASTKVGIIFTQDQTLLGIDLDSCLDRDNIISEQKEAIAQLIIEADTFTEKSVSGTGIHLYLALTAPLDLIANRHGSFEAYTSGRYFATTGISYKEEKEVREVTPEEALKLLGIVGYPWRAIKNEQKVAKSGSSSFDDQTILEKMFQAKNGDKIKALYNGDISAYNNDDSSADMAICMYLSFWCNKNAEQIERIWLASPLGSREKTQERKDYRDRTIANAIKNCEKVYSDNPPKSLLEDKKKMAQADILFEIIDNRKDTTLFHDEYSDGYISLEVEGHQEIWGCKSKAVKDWLSHEYWLMEEKALGSDVIKNVLATLEGKARFGGPEHKLNNRVAWHDNELWYDLTNKNWQAIRINKNNWEIVNKPPILFKRLSHQQQQVIPERNGDVSLFLKYIKVTNPEHRLLLLVFLISCFIPDYPHVMLVIFGAQGSSKSTMAKLTKLVNDPSHLDATGLTENLKELIQTLAHNYFLFFDNVSHISPEVSDILCKAVSGAGFSKRVLYEDDEDKIYKIKHCIGINGINLVTTRPDLLERSLLIELERINPEERKTESELYSDFREDLPKILGGIFDTLVKALAIKPTVKQASLPRMADFALWGCAIAEALGHTKEEFLTAYKNNIERQTEMLVNENIVATALITFMADKEEWKDTPTELLKQLSNHAEFAYIDTREKYWPKGAGPLSRKLNELSTPLKQMGIFVTINTTGTERYIHIRKGDRGNSI